MDCTAPTNYLVSFWLKSLTGVQIWRNLSRVMQLMSSSMHTIFVKRFELVFFRSRPGHTLQNSAKIISDKLHRLVYDLRSATLRVPQRTVNSRINTFLRLKPPTRQRKIIQTEEQIGYQRNSESPEAQIYDNENYSVSDGCPE
ncbi:hypothetical protein GCK72_000488 [Caenorhabditis remanei]|uniref:Uncharacterized protein n=1 Tax=Caenorhabditis remanei TaxID=31234 RepID=A0A6A5HM83_CAERE|nr:hypothetical protein GCK72_000488 [Caenorhabditis remanei]KAF1768675.1 hypothetical protein GCK72_000488 [Caenorhabditis remanei]